MSCPKCKPIVLGADVYPKNTLQDQPLVLEKNCVMGPSGATYCLKDNGDGTAYVDSSIEGWITAPFAIGYNADIKGIDVLSEYESVYVTTGLDNDRTYKIASQLKNTSFNKDAWKGITDINIPYDVDATVKYEDGCHGTDDYGLFEIKPPPVKVTAMGGALFIDDYIVTPELVTKHHDDDSYTPNPNISRIRPVLDCALSNSTSEAESIQIRSAVAMFESAEPTLFVSNGPYKFHHAAIMMTVPDGDIKIFSERRGNESITDLEITIDPNGLSNDKTFRVNRLGMVFDLSFYKGYPDKATPINFNDEDKRLYIGLLNQALEHDISAADRATIEQVIGFINNPPPLPEWMGKGGVRPFSS